MEDGEVDGEVNEQTDCLPKLEVNESLNSNLTENIYVG